MTRPARAAALAAILSLLAPAPAMAFDTGHHFDLTAAALSEVGAGRAAVRQVQIANWVTDYLNTPVFPDQAIARRFDLLHFDDLPTDAAVRARWAGLTANARKAVTEAAAAGDAETILTTLGMTLHAVQDFYSHSNWVDAHPRGPAAPFRSETYFSRPAPGLPLWTSLHPDRAPLPGLAHGDYFQGMNKDSPVRQGWTEAYVFAHAATREWVAAVAHWADAAKPGAWSAALAWKPPAAEARDLRRQVASAQRLSSFGSFGWMSGLGVVRRLVPTGVDGHWKGNGSGSLVGTALAALKGPSPKDSAVAAKAIALAPRLVAGFDDEIGLAAQVASLSGAPAPGGGGGVEAPSPLGHAVVIRTLAVTARRGGFDLLGAPDFYGRVAVAGQTYLEAPQVDRRAATPAWTTLALVPAGTRAVPVAYQLWDQDFPEADDPVAIAPTTDGVLRFSLDPATGTVSGLPDGVKVLPAPDGPGVELLAKGADAEIRLRVSAVRVAPPAGI